MKRCITSFALSLALVATVVAGSSAQSSAELKAAYAQMTEPALAAADVFVAKDYIIESHDFALRLDSAVIYLFEPITVAGQSHHWGAWFTGGGEIQFSPTPTTEARQLKLFTGEDAIAAPVFEGVLLFNDTTALDIRAGATQVEVGDIKDEQKEMRERFDRLTDNENHLFLFETLRNCVAPLRRPFIVTAAEPEDSDLLVYMFNPYLREEVSLFEDYKEFFVALFLEEVCRYSVYADDSRIRNNGIARERITPLRYDIESTVNVNGDLESAARMTFEVALSPSQMLMMRLHPEMAIDSIVSGDGSPLEHLRFDSWKNRTDSIYVFLDRPYTSGDTSAITVYTRGDMVLPEAPVYVMAGYQYWYPTYETARGANYQLSFRTPNSFPFVASGQLVADTTSGEWRHTVWQTEEPVTDVSFVAGEFEKYEFKTDVAPIDIMVSDALHRELRAQYAGELRFAERHVERQVADDVSQALKLFSTYFGDYGHERLLVCEGLKERSFSSEAMVHLSWQAVFLKDLWGKNRIERAAAVAQQWWGSGVRHETYRDQWLTDGLSEYSGLLYLQAAEGNDRFLWWLDQYSEEILSMHRLLSGKDKPTPPLALGHRVSGTETKFYTGALSDLFGAAARTQLSRAEASQFEIEDTEIFDDVGGDPDDPKDDVRRVLVRRTDTKTSFEAPKALTAGDGLLTDTLDANYHLVLHTKGAFVIHMLRNLLMDLETLDDSQFYVMMKDWYANYRGKRASTQEFRRMTEKYTGLDMGWFFDQWVYGSDIPTYEFSYEIGDKQDDGRYKPSVEIIQRDVPESFRMFVPIEIQFKGDKRFYMRLLVDRPELTVQLPPMDQKPEEIVLNPFHSVLAQVKQ